LSAIGSMMHCQLCTQKCRHGSRTRGRRIPGISGGACGGTVLKLRRGTRVALLRRFQPRLQFHLIHEAEGREPIDEGVLYDLFKFRDGGIEAVEIFVEY
jgi:hypothetical protein